MKTKNQIVSKAIVVAIIAACFSLNVQASNDHLTSDTTKMSKMKMDKKMTRKKANKMSTMKKDTTSKM